MELTNVPFNAHLAQHLRCTVRQRIPTSYQITNGSRCCQVTSPPFPTGFRLEDVFPTVATLETGVFNGEREGMGRRWGSLRYRVSEWIPSALTLHESGGSHVKGRICGGTINSTASRGLCATVAGYALRCVLMGKASRTHHPYAKVTVPPPPPSRPHVSPLVLPLVSPARSLYQCYHGAPR
ncbi:hypothetical protein BDN71DRAFT_457891 [Pleurotus eryngii]|uniref:Uncharacterized protein n=1 Tax=Pleurotus eryngii TaxID=5323 RepID=A0A9P6DA93_PLEER|nr:hypothetical protein BDN71DRAFT_457891 [Pleurotus eryngii]